VYTPAHGFSGSGSFSVSASDGLTNSAPASVTINVQAPQDLDGDGLPDVWESAYGTSDPNADDDGDGMTNLQEYLANTNPKNADSVLRITSETVDTSGHLTMTWASIGGSRYRVQFSDGDNGGFNGTFYDLTQHVTLEMDPAPPGALGSRSFTDDYTLTGNASSNDVRYFRVRAVK
jgi:hypothetical protein